MDFLAVPNNKLELNYIYVHFVEFSNCTQNDRRLNTTLSNLTYKNVYSISLDSILLDSISLNSILLDPDSIVEQQLQVLFIVIKCNSLV